MKGSEKAFLGGLALCGIVLACWLGYIALQSNDQNKQIVDLSESLENKSDALSETESEIDEVDDISRIKEKVTPEGNNLSDKGLASGGVIGAGVITGRALNEFGAPIVDADVSLKDVSFSDRIFTGDTGNLKQKVKFKKLTTKTGKDGTFSITKAPKFDIVRIVVIHPDYAPADKKIREFDGKSYDVGDLRLEYGCKVSGFVPI